MRIFTKLSIGLGLLGGCLLGQAGYSEDLTLYTPKSRAPMDVRKGASPIGAVTPAEISEFRGEFGGILYMGQRAYSFEHWPGKEMADCRQPAEGNACAACELILGHSSADYYFFRDRDGSCTLQAIDAHMQASDSAILKTLKTTAQKLLGRPVPGSKSVSKEVGWGGTGSGWKWEDEIDLAYLYMDVEQAGENTEGVARFQWRRAPLHH